MALWQQKPEAKEQISCPLQSQIGILYSPRITAYSPQVLTYVTHVHSLPKLTVSTTMRTHGNEGKQPVEEGKKHGQDYFLLCW